MKPYRDPYTGEVQISDEKLEELRALYKREHGEEITKMEALDMAHRLIALYRELLRFEVQKRAQK